MTAYTGPDIQIIYEDADLLVVNKPSGLVIHSDGRTEEPTLTDWVLSLYPDLLNIGGLHTLDNGRYAPRAGIVHRLDRETSGVVLIAKTDAAFWPLQQQFIAKTTEKTYLAFCLGVPAIKEGTIDFPVGRSRADYRQWTVPPIARGNLRDAKTDYRVLMSGVVDGQQYSLIEFKPKTGRTHQLRVHAKAAGFPILCDSRYETKTGLGFDRVALHAEKIAFKHPSTGKEMEVIAPLPADFSVAKEKLKTAA